MIESGSTKRYVLYTIGEILLVMIGILLALQVNNQNELRKDHKQYLIYIDGLIQDINSDIDDLANNEISNRRYAMAARNLLHAYTSDENFEELELESKEGPIKGDTLNFLLSIQRASFMAAPSINNFTIEDIKSSGQTSIFKNEDLKREIFEYYSRLGRFEEWWQGKLRVKYAMDDVKFELLDPGLLNLSNLNALNRLKVMEEYDINPDEVLKRIRSTEKLLYHVNTMIYSMDRISYENSSRTKLAQEVLSKLKEEKLRLE